MRAPFSRATELAVRPQVWGRTEMGDMMMSLERGICRLDFAIQASCRCSSMRTRHIFSRVIQSQTRSSRMTSRSANQRILHKGSMFSAHGRTTAAESHGEAPLGLLLSVIIRNVFPKFASCST